MSRKQEVLDHLATLTEDDLITLIVGNCKLCPKFIRNQCSNGLSFMSCDETLEFMIYGGKR